MSTISLVLLGVLQLVRYGFSGFGISFCALVLVGIVLIQRMTLRADRSGVVVVNYFSPQKVTWTDISDFRLARTGRFSTCLDVCRRNGTRLHARAITVTGLQAYRESEVDVILADLRQRLLDATGERPEDLDTRAIQDALVGADQGDYEQSMRLVAEGRIGAEELAERLVHRNKTV